MEKQRNSTTPNSPPSSPLFPGTLPSTPRGTFEDWAFSVLQHAAVIPILGYLGGGITDWSAANWGLRDGGLSKSEDIRGQRPFSSVFWIFQVPFGRKMAISADLQDGRPDTP